MIPNLENDSPLKSSTTFYTKSVLFAMWMIGLLPLSCLVAQDSSAIHRNLFYLEGGGPGGYYALQYGRVFFPNKQSHFTLSMGLSTYHLRDFNNDFRPDLIVPTGLHYHYGRTHQMHLGIGHTFSSLIQAKPPDFKAKRHWNHHGYLLLGYRFRKMGSPYFFDVAYCPLWERYRDFRHWGRVGLGRFF